MLAVETGDWEVARGKIREAKEMLARASQQDPTRVPSGSHQADSSGKMTKLSDMVCCEQARLMPCALVPDDSIRDNI